MTVNRYKEEIKRDNEQQNSHIQNVSMSLLVDTIVECPGRYLTIRYNFEVKLKIKINDHRGADRPLLGMNNSSRQEDTDLRKERYDLQNLETSSYSSRINLITSPPIKLTTKLQRIIETKLQIKLLIKLNRQQNKIQNQFCYINAD